MENSKKLYIIKLYFKSHKIKPMWQQNEIMAERGWEKAEANRDFICTDPVTIAWSFHSK